MRRPGSYGLMYHDVVREGELSGRSGGGPDRYKLAWSAFVAHLTAMKRLAALPPVVFGETRDRPHSGWALTFDDGGSSAVAVGEELARREWRGHFFVTTGLIGSAGFVDGDDIRELDRMGHVIGSHSVTHPPAMSRLPPPELLREWQVSTEYLSDLLGKRIRTASVPGGHYRPNVARMAARSGVEVLFTSEPVRRPRVESGCLVVGRYTVRRHTSASEAGAVAAGDAAPWLRQWATWNLRKPPKLLASRQYDRVRRSLLGLSEASRTPDA